MDKTLVEGKSLKFLYINSKISLLLTLLLQIKHSHSELLIIINNNNNNRKLKVGRPFNFDENLLQTLPKPSPSRIYIANVNEYLTEENLKSLFTPFGEIEQCSLIVRFNKLIE